MVGVLSGGGHARHQDSVTGGEKNKFWGKFPKCANFHYFLGEITKKESFLQNLQKKQFLLTNSGVTTSILGVLGLELHSSGTEPVTFFGAKSLPGGAQFSFEAKAVISGARPQNAPRGAGPGGGLGVLGPRKSGPA